jgi:membrane peptidoglycan carboxypeptidase
MRAPRRALRNLVWCVALAALAFLFADPLMRLSGVLLSHGKALALVQRYQAQLRESMAGAHLRYTPYADIPACAKEGIVSVEDKRFFSNTGIDLLAILRVTAASLKNDHEDHGGSTITQQLARIMIREPRSQPSVLAKALGLMRVLRYTLIVNHELTKPQIMELYFNAVYFGRHAQGIAQAAEAYFNVSLDRLSFGECLYLTGLPQAPAVFGRDPGGPIAMRRYRHVVATMLRNGYVTEETARELAREKLFGAVGPILESGAAGIAQAPGIAQ